MITLRPVRRALVPIDTDAAERIAARNYDEFQSDAEVREAIGARPDSVLRVTMAHCAVPEGSPAEGQDSPEALDRAAENFRELAESTLTRTVEDVLFVYEIRDPARPGVRQIGVGGMADTGQIRTEARPGGTVVRNEGIREEKARGRALLVERTGGIIGTVNLAVEDRAGAVVSALERYADSRAEDLRAVDERGCIHRVWLVPSEDGAADALLDALEREPEAYVADGNHRSAAAAMLGLEGYLAVVFPAGRMGLAPYNRLVNVNRLPRHDLVARLEESFQVELLTGRRGFQPAVTHEIGLYDGTDWLRLTPRPGSFEAASPARSVDADIVQHRIFHDVFGISDPRDSRLTFVGGNREAAWLESRVDGGDLAYAVTLAPVTIDEFIAVCRKGEFMPPKSTWFQPKLRMGLVMARMD